LTFDHIIEKHNFLLHNLRRPLLWLLELIDIFDLHELLYDLFSQIVDLLFICFES
jgi:hypothetical protein